MPPKVYPKLRQKDGSAEKDRIRRGYVAIDLLKRAVDGTTDLKERTVIKVLYYCALRASEVGLQPFSHFSARNKTLDILRLKGSTGWTYPLEPWVLEDLQAWTDERPAASPYLFPHPDDSQAPLDRFNVFRYWKRAAQRAGLKEELWHPHVLKHSIATHMMERGDDRDFVQQWLGHRDPKSTMVYVEIVGKRLKVGQQVMKGLVGELA